MRFSRAILKPCVSRGRGGFSITDLLAAVATGSLVVVVAIAFLTKSRAQARLSQCLGNLRQVNQAVLKFAEGHGNELPTVEGSPAPGGWWYYKELVKGYAGLTGASSASDTVFACPMDRGYGDGSAEAKPFCQSARHDYTSYVFNGVDLPGIPNIAGRKLDSIPKPQRTLLTMEWAAHAPLSWHRSRTGRANTPFYNNAESVVGFVDGHAAMVKIYYDGLNPAFTRDPAPGYDYQYSGD